MTPSPSSYLGQSIVDRVLQRGWLTPDELTRSVEVFAGRRGDLRLRAYERVAIEIDGLAFHSGPEEFQRDRTRQNWLQTYAGWIILRFIWDDLTKRPRYVVRTVEAQLAKRRRTER